MTVEPGQRNRTRIVSIKSGEPWDVYIGRANWSRRLKQSKWFNPFRIGKYGTREDVIEHYRQAIQSRPDLLAALPELRGKVLACWCKPAEGFKGRLLCHGQILAGLADGAPPEEVE
jgi:hypothetical protein